MATFSKRLKKLRKKKSVTLDELARAIDTTKTTLSRYENEKREPKMDMVKRIADYFNVTTDYLIGSTDEKKSADKIKAAIANDPELVSFWDEIADREDLKLLFKQTKDLEPKTVKQIIRIIKAIEDEEKELN